MSSITQERLATKTPAGIFYQVLRAEFNFSMRLAQDVLTAAQEILLGQPDDERVRPGQVRYVAGRHYDTWVFPTGDFARIHFRARAAADVTSVQLTRKVAKGRGVQGTFLRVFGADRLAETWDAASPPRINLRIVAASGGATGPE